jgi:hypothetical protein
MAEGLFGSLTEEPLEPGVTESLFPAEEEMSVPVDEELIVPFDAFPVIFTS